MQHVQSSMCRCRMRSCNLQVSSNIATQASASHLTCRSHPLALGKSFLQRYLLMLSVRVRRQTS